eukprot:Nk52_evm27s2367 gene=Nk52_evmTU27s2367
MIDQQAIEKPFFKPLYDLSLQAKPFLLGGFSGMFATTCIQPIDMVKVRIQLAGELGTTKNPMAIAMSIVRSEGILKLYGGLTAGLLRQATYTTARLGIYKTVTNKLRTEDGHLTLQNKVTSSLFAGGIAAVVGTPCDLALVRMQADGTLPLEKRRNYTNVFNALARITREEGFFSMWKGCAPTVVRAMALNLGMLATYDQAKDSLSSNLGMSGFRLQLGSSAIAGFCASAFSLPVDFIKTRIQKQHHGHKQEYKNALDCVFKIARNEGLFVFYHGFWTYYMRIAPHAMITLLTLEQLSKSSAALGWK